MSVVSGVTLQTSCTEDDGDLFLEIQRWLSDRTFGNLVRVETVFGGTKHPQTFVCGAGFNYFPEDEFAAFVVALPWRDPENVVLLIQPEEGGTRVFRP